jgi:hypothetical protein
MFPHAITIVSGVVFFVLGASHHLNQIKAI